MTQALEMKNYPAFVTLSTGQEKAFYNEQDAKSWANQQRAEIASVFPMDNGKKYQTASDKKSHIESRLLLGGRLDDFTNAYLKG